MFLESVHGNPRGKIFHRGDGDGELFPGGEFPVAIPTEGTSWASSAANHFSFHLPFSGFTISSFIP
jgi:hypothetical protein